MIARLPDWETRLIRAVETTPPFAWGASDCCSFAARVIQAMTGHDAMAEFHGRYITGVGALRLIRQGGGLALLLSARFGATLATPALAQRGDLVLVRTLGGDESVGICVGERIAVQGQGGVEYLPLAAGLAAWRV